MQHLMQKYIFLSKNNKINQINANYSMFIINN